VRLFALPTHYHPPFAYKQGKNGTLQCKDEISISFLIHC
jgi:hypothetical protein